VKEIKRMPFLSGLISLYRLQKQEIRIFEIVNNREEFGHFEMDLIIGKNHVGAALTITEGFLSSLSLAICHKEK
jgi:hypothetical protein